MGKSGGLARLAMHGKPRLRPRLGLAGQQDQRQNQP
jgi:hypothetical protein